MDGRVFPVRPFEILPFSCVQRTADGSTPEGKRPAGTDRRSPRSRGLSSVHRRIVWTCYRGAMGRVRAGGFFGHRSSGMREDGWVASTCRLVGSLPKTIVAPRPETPGTRGGSRPAVPEPRSAPRSPRSPSGAILIVRQTVSRRPGAPPSHSRAAAPPQNLNNGIDSLRRIRRPLAVHRGLLVLRAFARGHIATIAAPFSASHAFRRR